jgi:hypothetical protein
MPEAISITLSAPSNEPQTEIYRMISGKLYRKHPRHTVEELLLSLENPFRLDGVFRPLLEEIGRELFRINRSFKPWPDEIRRYLNGRMEAPEAVARILEQTQLVTPYGSEEFDSEIDFWREKFLNQVSLYAVMEGDLWVNAPEPVIQVSAGPPVKMFFNLLGDLSDLTESLQNYFFSIADYDAALSFATQLPGSHGRVSVDPYMKAEIVTSGLSSEDVATADIRRAGEHLKRKLFQFMGETAPGDCLDIARHRLIDQLQCTPFDPDKLAAVIDDTLSVCRVRHKRLGYIPMSHYEVSLYRRHLDKWDNRPVEVVSNKYKAPLLPST